VALNYVLAKPGVSSLIIGIRNIKHLDQNLKVMEWQITPEEVAMLDKASEPERQNPYDIYDPVKNAAKFDN
jgi:aryl-alcohol dehydrogenase-like predicted oxidoreductase